MDVEIQIQTRAASSKGETKKIRRKGMIPVVIYSKGKSSVYGSISQVDFETCLRNLQAGFLPTQIFSLKDQNGKKTRAILKDVQYEVTTYNVIHLDFQELVENTHVDVKVPVECLNQVDCAGVKEGGFLRPIMRHVKVRCLPRDIPSHFAIDVRELRLNQFKRVSDLGIPSAIRPLGRADDIVVTVVKR